MHLLLAHPFLAFLAWTLLAVAFGLGLGKAIAHADAIEEQERLGNWVDRLIKERAGTDTQVIDWSNAPREWTA